MKRTLSIIFTLFFVCMMSVASFAASTHPVRVVDNAQILKSSERTTLTNKLDEISQRQNVDVVVVTVSSIGSKSMQDYADDYYDYNDYGMGGNDDGILLLVNMSDRKIQISTHGYGITAFTDAGISYIIDQVSAKLKKKNYSEALTEYATLSDKFITQAKTGTPYDRNNLPKKNFEFGKNILISLVVGAIAAAIVMFILYKQMKNVAQKAAADDYVKKDSLNVTESRDRYLYTHTSRKARPKSSGGSSTHTSSSGRSHGGGGGSF